MLKMVKNTIFSIEMGINGVFVLILKWDMCVKIWLVSSIIIYINVLSNHTFLNT